MGKYKNSPQKPILLLTNGNTELEVIECFLEKCRSMEIEIKPESVAVLTRGRIHSDTDVKDLWKSKEMELIAKAAYEWKYGSRKRAYNDMSKASFRRASSFSECSCMHKAPISYFPASGGPCKKSLTQSVKRMDFILNNFEEDNK